MSFIYYDEFLVKGKDLLYNEVVEECMVCVSVEDLVNILYMFGIMGEFKGVMLYYFCYLEVFCIYDICLVDMIDKDVLMNFLLLIYVFEKVWIYFCVYKGVQVCINFCLVDIQIIIKEICLILMCSVFCFWEKVYVGVQEKIVEIIGIKKMLMLDVIKVGCIYNLDYLWVGKMFF